MSTAKENEWQDDNSQEWPDWSDTGRRMEIITEEGPTVVGELIADDVGFDGEDEYPVLMVVEANGTKHSFSQALKWRFVAEESEKT